MTPAETFQNAMRSTVITKNTFDRLLVRKISDDTHTTLPEAENIS